MNLDKPLTSSKSIFFSEREGRKDLMISKVISSFKFFAFPKLFGGEGSQAAAAGDSWERKEKENFRKFQNSEYNGGNIWFA